MDQPHSPNETASSAQNTPPYVPDETDLMYMDEAADVDVALPEHPEQFQEPHAAIHDRPVHTARLRPEVRCQRG